MKKLGTIFLSLFLVLSMMSGCSEKTIELDELLPQAVAANQDVTSLKMNVHMALDVTTSATNENDEEETASIQTISDGVVETTRSPYGMHLTMDAQNTADGKKEDVTVELYGIQQADETIALYSKTNDENWTQTSIDADTSIEYTCIANELFYVFSSDLVNDLDLEMGKTTKVNNKSAYVVNATLDADDIKQIIGYAPIEDYVGKFSYYFDTDSFELVRISFEYEDILSELFNAFGIEATFESSEFYVDFVETNCVDTISVSSDIIEEAESEIYGEDDESQEYIEGDASTQTHAWEDFKVELLGKTITINKTTLESVMDIGLEIDEEFSSSLDLAAGDQGTYFLNSTADEYVAVIVQNTTKDTVSAYTLPICFISTNGVDIKLSSTGIHLGTSIDEVKKLLGEPNYYTEGYQYMVYQKDDVVLEIFSEDGIVTEIGLGLAEE